MKRWRDGKMIVRSTVAAVADAATRFRLVTGAREGMAELMRALARHGSAGQRRVANEGGGVMALVALVAFTALVALAVLVPGTIATDDATGDLPSDGRTRVCPVRGHTRRATPARRSRLAARLRRHAIETRAPIDTGTRRPSLHRARGRHPPFDFAQGARALVAAIFELSRSDDRWRLVIYKLVMPVLQAQPEPPPSP